MILLKNNTHTVKCTCLEQTAWWIFTEGIPLHDHRPVQDTEHPQLLKSSPHVHSLLLPPTNHCLASVPIVLFAFLSFMQMDSYSLCFLMLNFCSPLCLWESPHGCVCLHFVHWLLHVIPPGDHTSVYFCWWIFRLLLCFWLVQVSLLSTRMYWVGQKVCLGFLSRLQKNPNKLFGQHNT